MQLVLNKHNPDEFEGVTLDHVTKLAIKPFLEIDYWTFCSGDESVFSLSGHQTCVAI